MLDFFTDLDTQLMLFLNGWHTPYWDNFMWLYSSKWVWLPFYAAFVFVILRNFKWRVSALIFVAIFLTIFFADQITATLLRPIFHRLRPCNLDNPLSQFIHVVANDRGGAYGFPSAHAANAFGFVFFFHYLFRRSWLSLLLFAWALMMCYTRIYLGRHYPGDLLVGAIVALLVRVCLIICFVTLQEVKKKSRYMESLSLLTSYSSRFSLFSSFPFSIPIRECGDIGNTRGKSSMNSLFRNHCGQAGRKGIQAYSRYH